MIGPILDAIRRAWRGTTVEAEAAHGCAGDACPIHGAASEPMEPVVEDMPRQRSTSLFVISDAERFALVRAKVALEMGIEPAPEVLRLIVAMHERASRLELEEHAEDFELWDAEVGEQ